MATETLRADAVLANNACINPANAQGAPDGTWTGNTDNTNWDCRWSLTNPVDPLTSGHTSHTAAVLVRKSASGGNGDPTVALELWSAGVLVRELVVATVVSSTTGVTLQDTFTTAEVGLGADLEVRLVVVGVGGSPAGRRNAQVDGFTVTVDTSAEVASFDGSGSASLSLSASGAGDFSVASFNGTAAAALALAASATGEFLEFAIFRRTPQTGAAFDPDVDTPIAEVVTSPYVDEDLSAGGYDYQVFRRTASGWSTGSNIEQVSVSAGTFNGTAAASIILSVSGTGVYEPVEFNGAASADLALSASGTGDFAPPGFNGQGSADLTLSASAQGFAEFDGLGSADLVLTVTAEGHGVYEATASAGVALSASGTGNFAPAGFNGQGSASLALSATGTGAYEPAVFNATAAAALVLSATGQGDAGVPTWSGQGSADLTLSATGDGFGEYERDGSAALVLSATGTGQFVPAGFNGQASANLILDVSGTGEFDPIWDGTGQAFLEVSASGVGEYEPAVFKGDGLAQLVLTALAFGTEGALPFIRIESMGASTALVASDSAVIGYESTGSVAVGIEGG